MDKFLLRKYLDGNCTVEEKATVEAYLADGNADQSLLEEAIALSWTGQPGESFPGEKETVLRRLHARIDEEQKIPAPAKQPVVRMNGMRKMVGYAVAAAAVVALFITVWNYQAGKTNTLPGPQTTAHSWKTIHNTSGHVQLATLPDSTRVWLSPQSTLSYAVTPGAPERLTRLEGEAFFDVAHDATTPFKILTGAVVTKVLGTAFNMEAYKEETFVKVSLVRGKVTLQHAGDSTTAIHAIDTLLAGQVITCDRNNFAAAKETLKGIDKQEWTRGSIVFNETPVQDALHRVAKRFGFNMQIDKDIHFGNKRLTSIFRQESPEQVLDNICFIADCAWRRQGNNIQLVRIGQ